MNKIYLLCFLLLISCSQEKDYEFKTQSMDSFQVLLSSKDNIGELLEFDGEGNFYLTDKSTKQIYKYSNNGELLSKTGSTGRGPNEFEKNKVLNIEVGKNTIIAHSQGGFVYNSYDTNLQIVDTYITEKPLSDISIVNDKKILISYLDLKTGNLIELRDKRFNKVVDGFNTLRHKSQYYGLLSLVSALDENKLIVGYLAVNQILIYSGGGKLIKKIKVPGFPEQAEPLKDIPIPVKVPAYLLFRDIYVDRVNKNILILEGSRSNFGDNTRNYSGSNLVHYLSSEGEYKFTYKLPIAIEQIAYFDNHLYGLKTDSLATKIVRFKHSK